MPSVQMTLPGLDSLSLPLQNLILLEVDAVLDRSPGGYAYNLLLDAWLDPLLNETRLVMATYANQAFMNLDQVRGMLFHWAGARAGDLLLSNNFNRIPITSMGLVSFFSKKLALPH